MAKVQKRSVKTGKPAPRGKKVLKAMEKKAAASPATSGVAKKKPKAKKFDYEQHWKGMPEFTQNDLAPIKQVIVNFANKEDLLKFSKLVGQLVDTKTRSIWYPEVKEESALNKRWVKK